MNKKRPNFKPRSPIPKQRLLKHLEDGLTLQEIADLYHKSRSTISETCTLYGIDITQIDGREEKIKERRAKKKHQSFIDIMYNKINKK